MHMGTPPDVKAVDLFPELSEDIDRRISASEQRVKYWVIVGALANSVGLMAIAMPVIFYLGQISNQFESVLVEVKEAKQYAQMDVEHKREEMVWRITAEQWMISKGFIPPAGKSR